MSEDKFSHCAAILSFHTEIKTYRRTLQIMKLTNGLKSGFKLQKSPYNTHSCIPLFLLYSLGV